MPIVLDPLGASGDDLPAAIVALWNATAGLSAAAALGDMDGPGLDTDPDLPYARFELERVDADAPNERVKYYNEAKVTFLLYGDDAQALGAFGDLIVDTFAGAQLSYSGPRLAILRHAGGSGPAKQRDATQAGNPLYEVKVELVALEVADTVTTYRATAGVDAAYGTTWDYSTVIDSGVWCAIEADAPRPVRAKGRFTMRRRYTCRFAGDPGLRYNDRIVPDGAAFGGLAMRALTPPVQSGGGGAMWAVQAEDVL